MHAIRLNSRQTCWSISEAKICLKLSSNVTAHCLRDEAAQLPFRRKTFLYVNYFPLHQVIRARFVCIRFRSVKFVIKGQTASFPRSVNSTKFIQRDNWINHGASLTLSSRFEGFLLCSSMASQLTSFRYQIRTSTVFHYRNNCQVTLLAGFFTPTDWPLRVATPWRRSPHLNSFCSVPGLLTWQSLQITVLTAMCVKCRT